MPKSELPAHAQAEYLLTCLENNELDDNVCNAMAQLCRSIMANAPLAIIKGGDPDGNDYEVPDQLAGEGFWLTVGKASIHIKDGDDGVSVSIYRLHSEMDDSLAEAWVTHGELEPEPEQVECG